MIERAIEHLGEPRAARWLRKAYPWYVARLDLGRHAAKDVNDALQRTATTAQARALVRGAVSLAVLG